MTANTEGSGSDEQIAAITHRDEALEVMLAVLDDAERGRVEIGVDHGQFEARFIYHPQGVGDTGISCILGERVPNLTDALVSLAEKLK